MSDALPLYRAESVRLIEREAAARGLSADLLMQRAGTAAALALRQHWPQARRIGVLCGVGNNGGDAYVAASHLREAGLAVELLAIAPPRSAEAMAARAAWCASGGVVAAFEDRLPEVEVWIDGLFGSGLSRRPEGLAAAAILALNRARAAGAAVLALDLPSGVDADRGALPGPAVVADRTLAFIAAKPGLLTGPALDAVGILHVADLGLAGVLAERTADAFALGPAALVLALPRRLRDSHKGDHGRVLVVGGETGMEGAIVLCAEAAARAGAGWVELASTPLAAATLRLRRPEVMGGVIPAAGRSAALQRADAIACGPGLGRAELATDWFEPVLASGRPLVLDADALNHLAAAPRPLPGAVLTPHPGEAARLLGTDSASVQADRWGALAALVERYAATVVLKGAGTLIGAPGERPRVIRAGNPGMASAGMGDALTGVVVAFRAQGLDPFRAAWAAALAHALAADAAAGGTQRGLLASDVIAALPGVLPP